MGYLVPPFESHTGDSPISEPSTGVFIPVLALFGAEYEPFQENPIERASDFAAIRPFFTYQEITGSGASVQREKPQEVAQQIIDFSVLD